MEILIITAHYKPEPNFITADLAHQLQLRGHFVSVITAHPNYPYGRFYDSVTSIAPEKSIEDGVQVWRLPFFPDHSRSKLKRSFSYLSFTGIASIFSIFCARRPKVVFVYQTPFSSALASIWFKYVLKAKVYFICCDLWPESFSATGVVESGLIMKIAYKYSRWINRRADFIVCSTRGMVARYRNDNIAPEKLAYVPVWTDGIPTNPTASGVQKFRNRNLVYAGNIGSAQGLDILLEAGKVLQDEDIDFRIDVYGSGTE